MLNARHPVCERTVHQSKLSFLADSYIIINTCHRRVKKSARWKSDQSETESSPSEPEDQSESDVQSKASERHTSPKSSTSELSEDDAHGSEREGNANGKAPKGRRAGRKAGTKARVSFSFCIRILNQHAVEGQDQ